MAALSGIMGRGGVFKHSHRLLFFEIEQHNHLAGKRLILSSGARFARSSLCWLQVLLAQGSPEHLFRICSFGFQPTNLRLTKQWHKAKRPHTTTF